MTEVDRGAMLAEAREELERADSKAEMLLSAVGVAVGVIAAGILASSWRPPDLHAPWEAFWWIGSGLVGVAIIVLASGIYPRIRLGPASPIITYFNDIARLDSKEDMDALLKDVSEEDRVVQQLFSVCKIVRRKYLRISWSMWIFAVAFPIVLLGVIAGH